MIAGNDSKISVYDSQGNSLRRFDYTNDNEVRDFTFAAVNPTGDTIVMGNFNRFYIYHLNKRAQVWDEVYFLFNFIFIYIAWNKSYSQLLYSYLWRLEI